MNNKVLNIEDITTKISNEFRKFLNKHKKKAEQKLKQVLKDRKPISLYEPAEFILQSPGKRLRPILVLFSAGAVGGNIDNAVYPAIAVELLHNFTLVHDDIMDNSDKRRGLQTLHNKYNLSTAVLAGDSLLAVAYECLLHDKKNINVEAISAFTKGLVEVCEGQSLDKEFETRDDVTLPEYMIMIEKKTASMIQMCCTLGALLSKSSLYEQIALEKYGRAIGLAFQIQDDLLDIIADEEELGKPVGGDLLEGKKTFLFLSALSRAQGEDLEMLKKVIKDKGISSDKLPQYKELYEKLGVLKEAEELIEFYTKEALCDLHYLKNSQYRDAFVWLAQVLLKRRK